MTDLSALSDAELQAEVRRRANENAEEERRSRFPLAVTMSIGRDKDSNWQDGEKAGLSEETIKASGFQYTLLEVIADVIIREDGSAVVTGFHYDRLLYEPSRSD